MPRRTLTTTTAMAVVVLAGSAGPAVAATSPDDLTVNDSLYVLPLGTPSIAPSCSLIFCPSVQALPPTGSGADAGATGFSATGVPGAPPDITAEARSEPLPYDGAGPKGTVSVAFSVERQAEGSGGASVSSSVRLDEVGGGTVAQFPSAAMPLDGVRRKAGPQAIDPAALKPGHSYVAVVDFRASVPAQSSMTARVFAPRLLALGPRKKKATKKFTPGKPKTTLSGRTLRVVARCPTGSARCAVQVRSSLSGSTLGKGKADLQAGAHQVFNFGLSTAEVRRARRVGSIVTSLRLKDENGRLGTSKTTLRVPKR